VALTVALAVALLAAACHKAPARTSPEVVAEEEAGEPPRAEPVPAAPPRSAGEAPSPLPDSTPSPLTSGAPEAIPIQDAIARSRGLLAGLAGLTLTPEQRLNAESAEAFTTMAQAALEEGDLTRASTLSAKALTLLEALAGEAPPPG
jgi:hypothetical protein